MYLGHICTVEFKLHAIIITATAKDLQEQV